MFRNARADIDGRVREIFCVESCATASSSAGAASHICFTTLPGIARSDPTQIASIEQLRGCSDIFTALIESAGVEAFIRAAYIYVLGRPADPTGLKLYGGLVTGGELSPFGLLQALCDGDEFRAVPRILIAPTEPGFIFSA